MQQEFRPPKGSTFFDVVLNTYLSLNSLPKFIQDNGITDLNALTEVGDVFVFDPEFASDEFLSTSIRNNGFLFTTGVLKVQVPPITDDSYLLTEDSDFLKTEQNNYIVL